MKKKVKILNFLIKILKDTIIFQGQRFNIWRARFQTWLITCLKKLVTSFYVQWNYAFLSFNRKTSSFLWVYLLKRDCLLNDDRWLPSKTHTFWDHEDCLTRILAAIIFHCYLIHQVLLISCLRIFLNISCIIFSA